VLQDKIETERRNREYTKWIKQAEDAEKEGNLSAAVKFYQKAQGYTDESFQSKIDSLNQQIAEKEKQSKFAELLAYVKARDNKTDGKDALKALEQALALYPNHQEALALKKKISGYYGPSPGEVKTNTIGMKLVYIPPGEFMMGSNDGDSDEKPVHKVRISKGFYMGVYEVTQAQWQAVMGTNPSNFKGDNLPVETVSWNDATEFCKKLSQKEGRTYRLPTEAEWEYACRADSNTRFCFGDNDSGLDDYAWYGYEKSGKQTHPVGQKKPNAFGLYDMHGNVWEWCQDWYDEDYYSRSPEVDPQGHDTGSARVLRGGSWGISPGACRSVDRSWFTPVNRGYSIGSRIIVLDFQ
jgi:formylglycine-generating enzyme required for sulfatase activity